MSNPRVTVEVIKPEDLEAALVGIAAIVKRPTEEEIRVVADALPEVKRVAFLYDVGRARSDSAAPTARIFTRLSEANTGTSKVTVQRR